MESPESATESVVHSKVESNTENLLQKNKEDEEYARKLHYILNGERPSRNKKTTKPSKRTPKAPKLDENGNIIKRKVNEDNPFNAPMYLSVALSEFAGVPELSRPVCLV